MTYVRYEIRQNVRTHMPYETHHEQPEVEIFADEDQGTSWNVVAVLRMQWNGDLLLRLKIRLLWPQIKGSLLAILSAT